MLYLLSKKLFQNRPNCNEAGYLGNDKPVVFLARLGQLFKENPVSQSDQ